MRSAINTIFDSITDSVVNRMKFRLYNNNTKQHFYIFPFLLCSANIIYEIMSGQKLFFSIKMVLRFLLDSLF